MLGDFWKAQVNLIFKCNVFKATVQSALPSGFCAWFLRLVFAPLQARTEFYRERALSLGSVSEQIGASTSCDDEKELGQLAKEDRHFEPGGWQSKFRMPIFSHKKVLTAICGQTRLDKYPGMTSKGKLAMHAAPWVKQFWDDIGVLGALTMVMIFCAK